MKNIFQIFYEDICKIHKNVIAWIVVLGITIVPSLYAWFNIAASWDPYGSTGDLKVAIASQDKGYTSELLPIKLNLGEQILSKLHENTQLDWVFTDAKSAKKGVKSGRYYAALVIPETFSQNMMSLFSSDIRHPEITYYINEKENAIAPKITDKGASAVQQQVNNSFTETISKTALETFQYVADVTAQSGDETFTKNLAASLAEISQDLSSAAGTVQAFSDMSNAASIMLDTTSSFLAQSGNGTQTSLNLLDDSKDSVRSLALSVTGTTDAVNQALADNQAFYTSISDALERSLHSFSSDSSAVTQALSSVGDRVQKLIDGYTSLSDSLTAIKKAHPVLAPAVDAINRLIAEAIEDQTAIKNELSNAQSHLSGTTEDAASLKAEIDTLISESVQSITAVKTDFEANIKEKLNNLATQANSTDSSVTALLQQINTSVSALSDTAEHSASNLSEVQGTLSDSASLLLELSEKLLSASNTLTVSGSDGLSVLASLLLEGPENVSTFLASPVRLSEHPVYAVDNYGSAMAPFYSTLSIWVGGVILVAMLKVTVADSTISKLKNPKMCHLYLGRSLLLLGIGLLQSSLICLGDLFYLQIQCEHPFLFLLVGWFTSIVYVSIIYALTVSFGDIGKAVCVILLVMQVAGSGGTFPIEVAPAFFQKVYPLLPFTHSMNAMRECIAGFYGSTYWKELGALALFLIPALLLGLILRKPVIRLNDTFSEKLESTHIF